MDTLKSNIQQALDRLDQLGDNPALRGQANVQTARETLSRLADQLGYEIKGNGIPQVLRDLRQTSTQLIRTITSSPQLRRGQRELLHSLRQLRRDSHRIAWSLEIPARRLLGVLPIRRVIPQDVHTLFDYGNAASAVLVGAISGNQRALLGGAVLALSGSSVSALTDYRLSLVKIIPIEVHEVIDHLWGVLAICAPFVLGYSKKARLATFFHVGLGVANIAGSLFTDYRAARGVGRVRSAQPSQG